LGHLNAGCTDHLTGDRCNRVCVTAERYGALKDSRQSVRSLVGSNEQSEGHGLYDMTRGTETSRDNFRGFVCAVQFQQAVAYTRIRQLGANVHKQVQWYAAFDGRHADRHHYCKSTGVCLFRVMGDTGDIPDNYAIVSRDRIQQKRERRDSHGRPCAGCVFAASAGQSPMRTG
jgi:hypothetical protein